MDTINDTKYTFQSPKSGHIVCNDYTFYDYAVEILFQSPKSGHIVCNTLDSSYNSTISKFQSPKSGHIVCNKNKKITTKDGTFELQSPKSGHIVLIDANSSFESI